jgi:hypothetical protein
MWRRQRENVRGITGESQTLLGVLSLLMLHATSETTSLLGVNASEIKNKQMLAT